MEKIVDHRLANVHDKPAPQLIKLRRKVTMLKLNGDATAGRKECVSLRGIMAGNEVARAQTSSLAASRKDIIVAVALLFLQNDVYLLLVKWKL